MDISIVKNDETKEMSRKTLMIPSGYYPTSESLIWALNYNMTDEMKTILKFSQSNDFFKAESLTGDHVLINFTPRLQNILGMHDEKTIDGYVYPVELEEENLVVYLKKSNQSFVASNPMDVTHYQPGVMLCHTNFVEHSIVGDSFLPVLKIVPTRSGSPNDYISIHFDNLEFVKPNVEYLKELHFELRDLEGKMIEFAEDRKVILNFVIKS